MKTNIAICSNEELRELDLEKGYTAISNQVAFEVLLNSKLAQASRLWMYFRFKQSGFENKTYIQQTYIEIANAFGVSKSTIKNWAYKLRNLGYLEIIEEKRDKLNNLPNKFRVCLPKGIHQNIKTLDNGFSPSLGAEKMFREDKEPSLESVNSGNVTDKDIVGANQTVPQAPSDTQEEVLSPPIREFNPRDNKALFSSLKELFNKKESTKFVAMYLDGVCIELHKNRVCFMDCNQFVVCAINSAKNSVLSAFNEATGLDCTEIDFNQHKRSVSQKTLSKHDREGEEVSQPYKPISRQQNKKIRNVYLHTQKRLKKRLLDMADMTFTPSQSEKYKNEIVYAVEQGCLSKFSITHGINIALKLINENRWKTPAGYTQEGSKN